MGRGWGGGDRPGLWGGVGVVEGAWSWSGSHGQGAGLGGGRLRPLRGAAVALLPAQLVVLEQTLLAAAIRDQQDACKQHNRPIRAVNVSEPLPGLLVRKANWRWLAWGSALCFPQCTFSY